MDEILEALGMCFLILFLAVTVSLGFVASGSVDASSAIKKGFFQYEGKVYRVIPADVVARQKGE